MLPDWQLLILHRLLCCVTPMTLVSWQQNSFPQRFVVPDGCRRPACSLRGPASGTLRLYCFAHDIAHVAESIYL